MSMCGGWRQDKPEPYQLVLIRELVVKDGKTEIDINHVGYWSGGIWCALSNEMIDGTRMPEGDWTGLSIVNIYGWQAISKMEPNV